MILAITPNLHSKVIDFLGDFGLVEAFPSVFLPSPAGPHPEVYTAVAEFCFIFGLSQILILVLRLISKDPVERIAGTGSGIVFWLSLSSFSNVLAAGAIAWFEFIGWLIVFIGLSLVARSLVILMSSAILRTR